MLKRIAVLLMVMAMVVMADWITNSVTITPDTIVGVKYGASLDYNIGKKYQVIAKANDTAAAGFKNDSLRFSVAYRTGITVKDATGKQSIVYGTATVIDTFKLYGDSVNVDTSTVPGYAVKVKAFTPDTCEYLQVYINTLTGHRVGKRVGDVLLDVKRFKTE